MVNVLSSLKVYPLTYFPHYLHPNNTLFLNGNEDDCGDDDDGAAGGEDEKFLPTLGVRSTYPIRLQLPTDVNAMVQQNIVLKLVQQKHDYLNDVEKLIGNYKRLSKCCYRILVLFHLNEEKDKMFEFPHLFPQRVHQQNPKTTPTVCI